MKRFRNEVWLGLFFLLVVGLLIYMYHAVGGRSAARHIEVEAVFASASGLVPDNYVMVAGVPIGMVETIRVEHNRAVVAMSIQSEAGLRQDARVRIRAKNLLGEKYVELVPQSPEAPLLVGGERLTLTETPVEMDEVFAALRPFFEQLDPMAPKLQAVLGELETLLKTLNETGGNKRETLERIIDRTDELLGQTNRLIADNEARLGRIASRLDDLSLTASKRAPALLAQADATLKRLDRIAQAVPIGTIEKIPATYAKLDQALDRLLPLAERLGGSGERVENILKSLDILLQRLLNIDELVVRRFLQEEGVNINLTQDAASRQRIEQLEHERSDEGSLKTDHRP